MSEAPYLFQIIENQIVRIEELVRENERLRSQQEPARNIDEELIDCKAAAALVGMSPGGLRQIARDGDVPGAKKIGGVWRFSKVALLSWER